MSTATLDFTLPEASPEAEELRAEVRELVAAELAASAWTPRCDSWLASFDPEFSRRIGARGWIGMAVPTEYGGSGHGALARYAVTEELLAAGAPVAAHWFADRQVGPSLLRYGTEEQRREHLPPIVRGERFFAIGMSEPDAGSDLASVRTRAAQVDGGWVLDGTKIWVSGAHRAHFCIVLARTTAVGDGPRHAGLSQFIVDLSQADVEVRPIRLLTGEHHFNEVVFADTFVPADALLGEAGSGWVQVTGELAFERSGPERFLSTFPLLAAAAETVGAEPRAKEEIGALVARLWNLRQMSLAVAGELAEGRAPELQAALVKDLGTAFEGDLIEAVRRVLRVEPEAGADEALPRLLAEAIQHSPGYTLRGGATEILRGVVARGVGVR